MKIPSHLLYICNGTFTATINLGMYQKRRYRLFTKLIKTIFEEFLAFTKKEKKKSKKQAKSSLNDILKT